MAKPTWSRCAPAIVALVLAVLFGWAAWERFRLPLTPLVDPDLRVYLRPGLQKLLGEGFHTYKGQCFLYPWLLYVVLWAGSDFRWITLVQGCLGLGTGTLLFGCWMQFRAMLPAPRLPAFAFQLLGALLVGVYLLSTATIEFERTLRPESTFAFFVVLNIYWNLRFIRERFVDGRGRRSLLSGGLAVYFSMAAWLLKPSFSVGLVLANLPVILSLFRAGQFVRDKGILVGVPIVVAALSLLWPEWTLRRGDPAGGIFLAQSLFSIHADLINDQMADDLARHAATPYAPGYVAAMHTALTGALRESREDAAKPWPALGFNADYLLYGARGKTSFIHRAFQESESREKAAEFCRYYYWRTFRLRPAAMAGKIARQLRVFYRWGDCPAYAAHASLRLDEDYQRSAIPMPRNDELMRYAPGNVLFARTQALQTSTLRIGPYPRVLWIDRFLALSHLGWCLWAVLLGVGAWRMKPLRAAFGVAAPVLLLLYSYNFGTVLALAIGHSLDVGRYSQYQLAYTIIPEFGSVWLALEAGAFFWLARRQTAQRKPAWNMMKNQWVPTETLTGDASPVPLAPPSVRILLFEGTRSGEEYRAAFPDTLAIPTGRIVTALDEIESDVLLMIDVDAGHSVDAVHGLVAAYTTAPADLIVGCGENAPGAVRAVSRLILRGAFGWSPRDPVSGAWLCSRRLYRNAPVFSRRDARALELELTLQAFDKGFSVRETPLPMIPGSEARSTQPWRANARLLRGLVAGSIFCQPLRLLGALGIMLLLLGVWLAYSPLRHAYQKKVHANPARVIASPVLLVAGLLSIQAGWLLEGAARRGREAFQLSLRRNNPDKF